MPLVIAGATSGSTTVQATDAVTATITLPSATDTLVGKITPSFTTTIGVGAATPSTSGAGITFPATQSASTDANTLDDYEEGTWTPSWNVTGGTWAASSYVATYTKTGRQVTCSLNWITTSISGTKVNVLNGLPFTSANDSNKYSACITPNKIGAVGQILVGQVGAAATSCGMQLTYQGAATGWGDLLTSAIAADSTINMTITYFV